MIYIGLCNCVLSKLKTNNILQFNMTHTFGRILCGRHVICRGTSASCEIWCSHQHYHHLVCDTMQSRTAPTFCRNLCVPQAWRWKQWAHLYWCLSDYTVLQPARQLSSGIFFLGLESLRSQITVCTDMDHMVILHHLEWYFFTVACEQVHDFKW
jgi:hypothetical protein